MNSPLEHIIAWYVGLSPTQREDTAVLVSLIMPGVTSDPLLDPQIADSFLAHISESGISNMKEYGLVLCIRTLIEHMVVGKRRDPEGWKQTRDMLEQLARTKDEKFLQRAAEIQLKGAQWVASCKKWDAMAGQHLSDDAVSRFYMHLPYAQ